MSGAAWGGAVGARPRLQAAAEGQPTAVELMPKELGEYPFSYQRGMLRGRLIIEVAS